MGPPAKRALLLVANGLWILCFTVLEGLWGWSPGKLLLGLRVWAAGDSEPPGLARALVRTVAHFAIVYLAATVLLWVAYGDPEAWWLELVSSFLSVLGCLLLLSTMRRRNGCRGPHEFLSGTRVVQLPRTDTADLLAGHPPRGLPGSARTPDLPERLGSFTVEGLLHATPERNVLIGTDPALGRTVWIELRDRGAPALAPARRDLHRAARLRWLGGGIHESWQWDALLAPHGVPASDLVAGGRRLEWYQARPVLEQLADELAAACADGTLPPMLTAEQVWLRPGGQVLLLDEPPGAASGEAQSPPEADQGRSLALLRQTAVLLLDRGEQPSFAPLGPVRRAALGIVVLGLLGAAAWSFLAGRPLVAGGLLFPGMLSAFWLAAALRAQAAHDRKGLVRSPLPGHADELLTRLLGVRRPYTTVEEVRADLRTTRDRPVRVTPSLRLAHLSLLAALLSPGLFMLFFFAKSFNGMAITALNKEIDDLEKTLAVLDGGRLRSFVQDRADRDSIIERYSGPAARRRLEDALTREKEDLRVRLEAANVVEWIVLRDDLHRAKQLLEPGHAVDLADFEPEQFLRAAEDAAGKVRHPERFRAYKGGNPEEPRLVALVFALVLVWPACWVAWAGVARGGLSYRRLGLSLVLANGRRAGRLRWAWRALVAWAPVTILLGLSVWLDAHHPGQARWSWASWGAALLVLVGVAVLAVRSPTRGPHDGLAGTYIVPR